MNLKNATALFKRPTNFTEKDSERQRAIDLNDLAREIQNRFTELERRITEIEEDIEE